MDLTTILLILLGVYKESNAALPFFVVKGLSQDWVGCCHQSYDEFYRLVARNRMRVFGAEQNVFFLMLRGQID